MDSGGPPDADPATAGVAIVRTVSGLLRSDQLGVVLPHEHVFIDVRSFCDPSRAQLTASASEALEQLRDDPFSLPDDAVLDDEATAVEELSRARAAGVSTVIDPTPDNLGGRPEGLRRVAQATGINVVMGCGSYLERTHPPSVAAASVSELARQFVAALAPGVIDESIRPGAIGEIGLSDDPTPAELRVLQAASAAQGEARVPLYIHLPAWRRAGHLALDIATQAGAAASGIVLCHMNPSADDVRYQRSLADRGAWLGYDMVGHGFFRYADGRSHPSDARTATAIASLLSDGICRLLVSNDVYLKILLARFGGPGYGQVLTHFADELRAAGLDEGSLRQLYEANPRALFEIAAAPGLAT